MCIYPWAAARHHTYTIKELKLKRKAMLESRQSTGITKQRFRKQRAEIRARIRNKGKQEIMGKAAQFSNRQQSPTNLWDYITRLRFSKGRRVSISLVGDQSIRASFACQVVAFQVFLRLSGKRKVRGR